MVNLQKIRTPDSKPTPTSTLFRVFSIISFSILLFSCDPQAKKTSASGQVFGDGSKKASWTPKYKKQKLKGASRLEPQMHKPKKLY